LVICGTGHASEVSGEWATQGNAAHVRIERCARAPELLCGLVTWLWEPIDAEGEPVRDKHNPGAGQSVHDAILNGSLLRLRRS
jgi:hypothetical protein